MSLPTNEKIAVSVSDDGGVYLAGLPVFTGDDGELLNEIGTQISAGRRCLIVTANVDQALDLSRSVELWHAYKHASIRTLDGMPLVWLCRLLGARDVNRQTGADLLTKCASVSSERRWKVAILGGGSTANEEAVKRLKSDFPLANIVGIQMPYMDNFQARPALELVDKLWQEHPDVVFICLGSPKQEKFVMDLREKLPPAVYVGAGAAVDFASGMKKRAPKFVQKAGLEWLWRLSQEPRRLGYRYLVKGSGIARIIHNSTLRKLA